MRLKPSLSRRPSIYGANWSPAESSALARRPNRCWRALEQISNRPAEPPHPPTHETPNRRSWSGPFGQTVPPLADAAAWSRLMIECDGIARAWSTFMADRPLLLSPNWTQLPFEHGFDSATPAGTAATKELMRPMVPANLLGLPSACVPAGRDEGTGLPIGVLITGRRLREDLCLEAAEAIEARLGLATPIDPVG